MHVPMVEVGIVRVGVDEMRVNVAMRMRLVRRIRCFVRVTMVLVMNVVVRVIERFMRVLVLVPFRDMEPDTDRHQGGGDGESCGDRFM